MKILLESNTYIDISLYVDDKSEAGGQGSVLYFVYVNGKKELTTLLYQHAYKYFLECFMRYRNTAA